MIQSVAKFLLVVLCYPSLPMRDPGTSYAPSVAAAEEGKGRNNLLWIAAWYFGVVGLSAVFGGQIAHEIAAGFVLLWFVILFLPAIGWSTVAVLLFFGSVELKLFALAVALFSVGHFVLTLSLRSLSMDSWEREKFKKEVNNRRTREKAFLKFLNRR